jgi:hypothetical protein
MNGFFHAASLSPKTQNNADEQDPPRSSALFFLDMAAFPPY